MSPFGLVVSYLQNHRQRLEQCLQRIVGAGDKASASELTSFAIFVFAERPKQRDGDERQWTENCSRGLEKMLERRVTVQNG